MHDWKKLRSFWIVLLIYAVVSFDCARGQQAGAPPANQQTEHTAATDQLRQKERQIDQRAQSTTGIMVGQPKVYDDSQLQQMLSAAVARLASLQVLDQASIVSHLGSVTGATQSISAVGISAQGPTLPQVATTNTGPTTSTQNGTSNTSNTVTNPGTSDVATSQTTNTAPTTSATTTSPQISPPTATVPAATTSLPSTFGVSASDLLGQQMELTYEIANLRLLLGGSLTDWTIGTTKIVKPRVTLGFPITIDPGKRVKDATAVVEVEVAKDPNEPPTNTTDLPALLTLLPQEKTYNVAKITDNSVAISAGIATQAFSVAGGFARGTKTYYLVKDVDTVALTFQPSDPKRIGFLWEFRPVLGQRYIRGGLKQTFVQIAFPTDWSAPTFGSVHIRTYWKYFDRKQGYAKRVLHNSLRESPTDWPITNYSLEQIPKTFDNDSIEDLGSGQMLVNIYGRFLDGTYVRIGNTFLRDGNPAFFSEYLHIRFVASIADLATKPVVLVARDGTEHPLTFTSDAFKTPLAKPSATLIPIDDSTTQVTLTFANKIEKQDAYPPILIVGGKVYGYRDAPLLRTDTTMSALVPTATLLGNPTITAKALFAPDAYSANAKVAAVTSPAGSQIPKLALLEQTDTALKYIVYGPGLDDATVVAPSAVKWEKLPAAGDHPLHTVTLTKDQAKAEKSLILRATNGLQFVLAFPKADIPDVNKYNLKPLRPAVVGDDQVIFQGDGLADLQKVLFKGAELKLRKQADGKMIWISGLRASGVTAEAKTQNLEFDFKSGKTSISLVVAAKP